jgi:molecular chaperone IbpA
MQNKNVLTNNKGLNLSQFMSVLIGGEQMMHNLNQSSHLNENFIYHSIEAINEDEYELTLAVAGFSEDNINITQLEKVLKIEGTLERDNKERKFLHKGIAERDFTKKFILGDYIEVGNASLVNGILSIRLIKNTPEKMKPKQIMIQNNDRETPP